MTIESNGAKESHEDENSQDSASGRREFVRDIGRALFAITVVDIADSSFIETAEAQSSGGCGQGVPDGGCEIGEPDGNCGFKTSTGAMDPDEACEQGTLWDDNDESCGDQKGWRDETCHSTNIDENCSKESNPGFTDNDESCSSTSTDESCAQGSQTEVDESCGPTTADENCQDASGPGTTDPDESCTNSAMDPDQSCSKSGPYDEDEHCGVGAPPNQDADEACGAGWHWVDADGGP